MHHNNESGQKIINKLNESKKKMTIIKMVKQLNELIYNYNRNCFNRTNSLKYHLIRTKSGQESGQI